MRRIARENLNMPLAHPFGIFAGNIAANLLEAVEPFLIPLLPARGQISKVRIVISFKSLPILNRPISSLAQISNKPALESLMRQLLQQNRRESNRDRRPRFEQRRLPDHVENRQISLRRGLVQPGLAVRIRPMVQHIRKVSVQDDAKCSQSHRRRILTAEAQEDY